MEEYIEMCSQFKEQVEFSNDEMKNHCKELFLIL